LDDDEEGFIGSADDDRVMVADVKEVGKMVDVVIVVVVVMLTMLKQSTVGSV